MSAIQVVTYSVGISRTLDSARKFVGKWHATTDFVRVLYDVLGYMSIGYYYLTDAYKFLALRREMHYRYSRLSFWHFKAFRGELREKENNITDLGPWKDRLRQPVHYF